MIARVRVYRNLKYGRKARPLYSVVYKGRVIKRVRRILLSNCRFIVLERGRQRCLKEKQKNVHAFVEGIDVGARGCFGIDKNGSDFGVRVSYDPYVADHFFSTERKNKITLAGGVLLNERGISACYTA